ncbi:MAG: hypothetical protein ACJ8F7_11145 [Gemmataceae bacterium]
MLKRIDRRSFTAKDQSGRTHHLVKVVEIIDVANFTDPNAEVEGTWRIETKRGERLRQIDKGKFKLEDGTELTSDDPIAM